MNKREKLLRKRKSQLKKLHAWFNKTGIDWRSWGKDDTKSLEDLLREIEKGICRVIPDQEGRPIRQYRSVLLNVHFVINENVAQRLVEVKQVLKTGEERTRRCEASLGGKLLPRERVHHAARRIAKEELGLRCNFGLLPLDPIPEEVHVAEPNSYSTLPTMNCKYVLSCIICSDMYDMDGYTRRRRRKHDPVRLTYFKWVPVSTSCQTLAHFFDR